jgi:iron(III) transport system ATP-binding protein
MRDGRVVQEGTPRQIYEQPANEFVADVVGAANFLDVMSEPVGTGGARVWLPGGATVDVLRGSVGGAVSRLMLRPDRVAIAPANAPDGLPAARISGTVRQRLYQGSHFEYVVAIDAATTLRVFARAEIAEGSAVLLGINGADCVLVESTTDKQGAGKPCR